MTQTEIVSLEKATPIDSKVMVKYRGRNYPMTIIEKNVVHAMFTTWLEAVIDFNDSVVIGQLPNHPEAALIPFDDYLELRRFKELSTRTNYDSVDDMAANIPSVDQPRIIYKED